MNLKEFLETIRALKNFIKHLYVENPNFEEDELGLGGKELDDIWENHKPIPDQYAKWKVKEWYFDEDDFENLYIELEEEK